MASLGDILPMVLLLLFGQKEIDTDEVKYVFFSKVDIGSVQYVSTSPSDDSLLKNSGCQASDELIVIVPGWGETIEQLWVRHMIENLAKDDCPKCIVAVDYSCYSNSESFITLYSYYNALTRNMAAMMGNFWRNGFCRKQCRVIGFSLGSEIGLGAGQILGESDRPGKIDAIERVNPDEDFQKLFTTRPAQSAGHVQCIHSSGDFGTTVHDACSEDWMMGNCGLTQDAAGPFPYGSHGLGPYFYVYGMCFPFLSIAKPAQCVCENEKRVELAYSAGPQQRMGYKKEEICGSFYAPTYRCPPYNKPNQKCESCEPYPGE